MCNAAVAESLGAPGVPRAETGFIFIGNIESVTQTGEECPTAALSHPTPATRLSQALISPSKFE